MMKIAFVLAAGLGLSVTSGCSSSSSAPAGSDSGSDAVAAPDGMNPLGAPAAGKCPGVPCATGQTCCYNPLSNTGLCQDPSMTCTGSQTMLKCSGPADCSGGQGCCIKGTFGMGAPMVMSACVTPDQCAASPPGMGMGMGFTLLLCDSTHACPAGENCVPSMFGQGSFCIPPDAGAGEASTPSDGQAPSDAPTGG
jgi:hypothetical protein